MTANEAAGAADLLAKYHRAHDGFDRIMAAIPADAWSRPSACDQWTLADVAGHVTWGQQLVAALATEGRWDNGDGAPGTATPRVVVGDDPLGRWRTARDHCREVLTPEALATVVEVGGPFGTGPLAVLAQALATVDTPAHTWDIGWGAGVDVVLDADLIEEGHAAVQALGITRDTPGGLKAPLDPPSEADAQTRYLAFLGRRAWR